MAVDPGVKTIIAKLQLDGADLSSAMDAARKKLGEYAAASSAAATKDQQQSELSLAKALAQVLAQQRLTASKEASAKADADAANKANAYAAQQLENLKKQGEQLDAQNEKIALSIELMKKRAEESEKEGEEESKLFELSKKLGASVTEGAFGGGILGGSLSTFIESASIFAALNAGINLAIEGVGKLTEKIKEFIEDSGGLQKVTDTFQKLSAGRNINATEFLEQLRGATHGLVSDVDLLKEANTFLQSGMKLTSDQVVKLTQATVGLARAQGGDADRAVQQLTRSFLTGRAQMLGYVTGIQSAVLGAKGLGSTLTEQTKTNLSFAQSVEVIEKRYEAVKEPILTYTELLRQIKNTQGILFEALAQGVVKSSGFTEFMKQVEVVVTAMGGLEGLAEKVGNGIGQVFGVAAQVLRSLPQLFTDVKESFGELWDVASKASDAINNVFGYKETEDSFSKLHPILSAFITLWANLSGAIRMAAVDLNTFAKIASNEQQIFSDVGTHLSQGTQQIERAHSAGDVAKGLRTMYGGYGTAPSNAKIIDEGDKQVKQIQEDIKKQIEESRKTAGEQEGEVKPEGAVPPQIGDPGLARRNALELAKAMEQDKIAAAKDGLEQIKAVIAEETDANEEEYKKGNISIEAYYHNKTQLAQQTAVATKAAAAAETLAQEALLDKQVQLDQKFKNSADIQKSALEKGLSRQDTAADTTLSQQESKNRIALATDLSQAQIKNINAVLDSNKIAIGEQVDATKAQFEQGSIDSNTYFQQRIAQITALSDAETTASKKRADEQLQNHNAQAAELKIQLGAAEQAIKQLDELQNNALPQVFEKTSKQFSSALGSNSTLQAINAAGGADITGQSTQQLQTQQEQLLQGQVAQMQQLLQYATPYSDTWYSIYENILKATQESKQLSNELENQYATSSQIGGLFSQIGSSSKGLFTGTFGRGFVSSFAGGASVLAGATKTQQEFKADLLPKGGKTTDPVMAAAQEAATQLTSTSTRGSTALEQFTTALQTAIQGLQNFISGLQGKAGGTASDGSLPSSSSLGLDQSSGGALNTVLGGIKAPNVGSGSGSSSGGLFDSLSASIKGIAGGQPGSFGQLTSVLTTATKAIGNFASVIASSTSPLGGAFGGAQAGAGLGQSLGLGPLGAIGGAVGGAALGAIVGQKQQEVQQDIVNIQLAARQMQEAFSAGSASLNSTITTLQGIITTLTQEKNSSKKGSSQFQDLINQYNQQLSQLEAQQTQAIQQLQQQLASVSSPAAYQQWIQNIDSVIQQYSQFAGAAQNATQLAQANEYLTSSLQNIGQQVGNELMQDEETAIQNALQLNQLYNQRNQLELQYLNQVQSIESQGNLTRQRTQAQSAYSQLYDAQVNYSQQLDSINQQIALSQYQLSNEQQIFNLATTKAGLEQQLLTLQEAGVNQDMQRIAALQNVLTTLQSSGYSIANLGSLSSNDPNALQNTLLQDLINELNTGQGTMANQLQQIVDLLSSSGGLAVTTGPQAAVIPNTSAIAAANPNVLTDIISAAYQSRAQFAYGAFRAQQF